MFCCLKDDVFISKLFYVNHHRHYIGNDILNSAIFAIAIDKNIYLTNMMSATLFITVKLPK